jgi:AraC family transcriptional regulator
MATARALFEGSDLYFAELVCQPDDPEWGEENVTTHPIVALPSTPVWQVHDGAERTLMTPNHAVFHHEGGEYHRERFRTDGYRCLFFFPSDALVREIVAEVDHSTSEADRFRFPLNAAPMPSRAFGLGRRLARALSTATVEPAGAREGLYAVLRYAVLGAFRHRPAPRLPRAKTTAAYARTVEEAKALIARRLEDRLPLDEVAGELHVSPYHLARIFRSGTGYSVHAYQTHLRLREGLDRLERSRTGQVARIAGDLGFSNHSHFTASFRTAFGLRPSDVEAGRFSTA